MARLIDADELLDWSEIIPLTDDGGIDINDFEEKLKTMPTIDAVQVIRCKDCKYYEEQDETIGTCLLTESGAHIKGYCSWAEMKEE